RQPEAYYGGPEWMSFATSVKEEPRSGFPAGELSKILTEHGLRLDSHVDPDQLAERYLRRSDGSPAARPVGFTAIAHAFIATKSSRDVVWSTPDRPAQGRAFRPSSSTSS